MRFGVMVSGLPADALNSALPEAVGDDGVALDAQPATVTSTVANKATVRVVYAIRIT
jgi:hypothetical protein